MADKVKVWFDKEGDGKIPLSGLTQTPDGTIYGTTNQGGSADLGTVVKLTF